MVQLPQHLSRHAITRWIMMLFLFAGFGFTFIPFLTPIIMAGLFAFALDPFVTRWSHKKKTKRKAPAILIILSLFLLFIIPVTIVTSRIIAKSRELSEGGIESNPLLKSLENLIMGISDHINDLGSQLGIAKLSEEISGFTSKAATWALGLTTSVASHLPQIIIGIFIFSCALYYFLTQGRQLKRTILNFDLLAEDQLNQIISVVQKSSYITLVMAGVIGSVQALIVSSFAWFCSYHEFFLVFLLTFFMSLIPVIGAAPMAVIIAILSFAQGENGSGLTMIVAAIIAGSIDNILKPLMVSSQDDDIHPVVSLIALIGAVLVYGFAGLLLGPVLTQLSFRIIPILNTNRNLDPDQQGDSI